MHQLLNLPPPLGQLLGLGRGLGVDLEGGAVLGLGFGVRPSTFAAYGVPKRRLKLMTLEAKLTDPIRVAVRARLVLEPPALLAAG